MTDPTPLSPAALAVLDAYMNNCGWLDGPLEKDYRCAAAALRAAADHLKTIAPWVGHLESPGLDWGVMELESIAAELEDANG